MSYRPRRAPRTEYLDVRGLTHRVLRWGPPSDDPVVLLHGWADCADTFQFVVDALERDWPLAAFDWRGFGHTARAPDYWFVDYFADLDTLLDRLCPHRPARLAGHSMGGNVSLWYGGIRPGRVRRIFDLEGFGLPRAEPSRAPGRLAKWLDQLKAPPAFGEYPSVEELARLLVRRNPRLTQQRALFIANAWTKPRAAGGVELLSDPRHKLVNPYLYRRDEAEACWRRITAPVLLVLAGKSEHLPKLGADATEQAFRAAIPHIRIEWLHEATHALHHEEPERVAALLEAFLLEDES